MPTDRNDTLRRAESFLRQGRLDAAIAEYSKIVAEFPADLATANLLGDVYLRAGRPDAAVAEYTRMAEHLAREGFVPKASALYKKIIKIKPDDDHALLRMADLATQQGLTAEARMWLQSLYDARVARGDRKGAADIAVRRVEAEPADVAGRLEAARLLAELGIAAAAGEQLREAGFELLRRGRPAGGLRALCEALDCNPDDEAARERLVDAYLEAGDLDAAAQAARSASQAGRVSMAMLASGLAEAAVACLARVRAERPGDAALDLELARIELARGRIDEALAALPPRSDQEEVATALLRVEVLARAGRVTEAQGLVRQTAARNAAAAEQSARLCLSLADTDSALAFACISQVVEAARQFGDLRAAGAALTRLADVSSNPVEVLSLLVEVCNDLVDEDGAYHGQVRLADALLAAGRFGEARAVAEQLIEKRPDVTQHAQRLRRAIDGLGPGAGLMADDGLSVVEQGVPVEAPHLSEMASPEVFDLEPVDADLDSLLDAPDVSGSAGDTQEVFEIDLSRALDDLVGSREVTPAPLPDAVPDASWGPAIPTDAQPDPTRDLDGFFQAMRDEAGVEEAADSASRSFDRASQAHNEGRLDEAERHLRESARDPAFRFRASALLAKITRESGRPGEAIDWLERAAESPAPSVGARDGLLHELGKALEEAGEVRRALAVFLELQSLSPGYRDVEARIARLGPYARSRDGLAGGRVGE